MGATYRSSSKKKRVISEDEIVVWEWWEKVSNGEIRSYHIILDYIILDYITSHYIILD